ncbi:MAG TPA: bifunctional phosphopantothenoylcysteine decarboxylase/phosphopantothenate--cysteine ligase CoaBC [Patescibacteria group bacterium]|nr:bifunctional phosphopantothenoylcysteine decarboxylase/phosphopantothenate--cysteine ligase CoaBC [Patescibacteria group bacterium]
MGALNGKSVLLIISGGIAAYKALELIRLIRRDGGKVRCILTDGGAQFVTALSVASLSNEPVYTDLFSLKDEAEMGHIRLSREADLVVVVPASADIIAKMAAGMANDLATTTLLATDKKVMIAPAMNPMMWEHLATQANIATLQQRGVLQIGPAPGDMACGETGMGRMAEAEDIFAAISDFFLQNRKLAGLKALVTSGPTFEPLDPVRFIGNRSSGKQGHAIAEALCARGAEVTLVTGPVNIPDPAGVNVIHVETAAQMLAVCQKQLPVDIFVGAAAVSDWAAADVAEKKIKKSGAPPSLKLKENPDILATLSKPGKKRPQLVIGFAAETGDLLKNARAKMKSKGCDWIIANEVAGAKKIFGSDENHVYLLENQKQGELQWQGTKRHIAGLLADHIALWLTSGASSRAAE